MKNVKTFVAGPGIGLKVCGTDLLNGFLKVFINNLCIFLCNFYSIKINKTGVNEKTTNEGIIAPFVFTVMSAILIYGLSDRIYT